MKLNNDIFELAELEDVETPTNNYWDLLGEVKVYEYKINWLTKAWKLITRGGQDGGQN